MEVTSSIGALETAGTPSSSPSADVSHGTAACASGNALFSVSPIALGSVIGWVPLGAIEPPGHTFPSDHQGLYFANPSSNGNIYCYQGVVENSAGMTGVTLLQLTNASTLKIEVLASNITSCAAAQPWTFSSNAVIYQR